MWPANPPPADNMFSHFKSNRKTKSVFEEQDESDEEDEEDNNNKLSSLKEFIPHSIIEFILE